MQDELVPAKEAAAYWVEHVLRHGGAKHLHSPGKNMPFYKRYMIDVWFVLLASLVLSILLITKLISFLLRRKENQVQSAKIKSQ